VRYPVRQTNNGRGGLTLSATSSDVWVEPSRRISTTPGKGWALERSCSTASMSF
jgi:hypothetical protein